MSDFLPEGKEKLHNVIETIKNQLGAGGKALETITSFDLEKMNCDSTEDMQTFNKEDVTEQLDLSENETSANWKSQEDRSLTKSHIMFENNSNLCWLDSSMSLLCHNRTLSRIVDENSSQIANIRKGYGGAISVLNDYSNESAIEERLQKAKNILQRIQETVLDYLKPILKCKEGEPDSAFCSLLNLINEDKQVKNLFLGEFSLVRNCTKCAIPRIRNVKKTIITLSKVVSFNPCSPVSLYKCPFCESSDQEMVIKYQTLPQCLIFHFENGAGEGDLDSLDFELNDRKYKLSGLIKLERSRDLTVSHFVTWIRDIATDSWLECNDLNTDISSFSVVPPVINLKDIYIAMYEALDDKGTIANCSENINDTFKTDTDDTNSSDIPVIDLLDEDEGTERKQENQTDKGICNTVFLGGLFKPDKTDYDSVEKMPQQFDKILSDRVSSVKSMPEPSENNAESKNEKIHTENSRLLNLDLQDNDLSASSVKNHETPLRKDVPSESVSCNSQSNSKNDPENNVDMTIKQSLVKGSIKMCTGDKVKLFFPYNSYEIPFPSKPFLSNSVKTSKEINGNNISSIEKMETLIDKKVNNTVKRLEENIPGKADAVTLNSTSRKNFSNTFENPDNNKNSTFSRKNPINSQNKNLDFSISTETNNSNLNGNCSSSKNPPTSFENQDKNECCSQISPDELQNGKLDRKISVDCTQTSVEPCSGLSDFSSSHIELKNKIKRDNFVPKTFKSVKEEKCAESTAMDFLDNLLTVHDDEQADEIPTLLDGDLPSSDTQSQLQESGLHSSALPENDKCNLESKSVDTVEAKTQDINTRLPLESQILDKKTSEISSNEIYRETECAAIKQNHILTNTTLEKEPDEKSALTSFDNKTNINISKSVVAKYDDKSVKEVFVDANNLTLDASIKECNLYAKLESVIPQVSGNKNFTSRMHQTKFLSSTAIKQPEVTLDLSVNTNEQLNIQAVESKENTERVSLKKTAMEQNGEIEEKHTIFSQKEIEGKNLPTKELFVKLTMLKESEIEQHLSGNFNFEKTKQIKSLEELTRTVVVKVEQTDSKSILKLNARQVGPSKPTKVENIEPVRKSSRIFARKMKKAAEAEKAECLLEPSSRKRKNFEEQFVNSIYTKQSAHKRRCQTVPTEVTEKTLKMEDLSKRSYKTHSATDVHASVSSNTFSPKNTKKIDSNVDVGMKSIGQRANSVKTDNSEIQRHLPTLLSLEGTSASQMVNDESDGLLRALGPSPDENVGMDEIVLNHGNQVSVQDVSQSSSIHKHKARSVKENTHVCGKTGEYSPDCDSDDFQDLHEAVEYSSNYLYLDVFNFFFISKKESSR